MTDTRYKVRIRWTRVTESDVVEERREYAPDAMTAVGRAVRESLVPFPWKIGSITVEDAPFRGEDP